MPPTAIFKATVAVGRSMQKLLIIVTVAALGLALPAHAGFINLNAPYVAGLTFTPLPGNTVEASSSGYSWGGTVAGYQYVSGTCCLLETAAAVFGPIDLIGQPTSNYNYTTNGTASLSFNGTIYDQSGDGNVIAIDQLAATIMWNSIYFVDDGSYSVGPVLYGTGIVTSSTGDDAFEADFPRDGTFNITAEFLSQCGRSSGSCAPDQILYTSLFNGSVNPVPSPLIGKPGWPMLLCLAVLGVMLVQRADPIPRPWQWVRAGIERGRSDARAWATAEGGSCGRGRAGG